MFNKNPSDLYAYYSLRNIDQYDRNFFFGLDPLSLFFHYTFWPALGAPAPFTHHLKHMHICMKKDQSKTVQQIDTLNYQLLCCVCL